jgi:hypothetical protein
MLKRIYDVLPNDFNDNLDTKRYCNKSFLLKLKYNITDDVYSKDKNTLTRLDVFGLLTDDFHTIRMKKHIVDYLKNKYDCFKLKMLGTGLSNDKNNMEHNVYVVFDNNKIKIINNIK